MAQIKSLKENKNDEDNAVRLELQQALIDDSHNEHMAIGTILHRSNYLYSLISQREQLSSKETYAYRSFSTSISREAKLILALIEEFSILKIKHCDHQNAILQRMVKTIRKYR